MWKEGTDDQHRYVLQNAVQRRVPSAFARVMAVVASLVGAATLFCLAMICLAVPQQMNEEMTCVRREPDCHAHRIDQC